MWPVAFVVGFGPCQLFQHLSTSRRRPTIIQPVLTPSKLHAREQQNTTVSLSFRVLSDAGGAPWPPDSAHSTPD
jgi:hypothetical protein